MLVLDAPRTVGKTMRASGRSEENCILGWDEL